MTALNPSCALARRSAEAIRAHHPGQTREEVGRQVIAALERAPCRLWLAHAGSILINCRAACDNAR